MRVRRYLHDMAHNKRATVGNRIFPPKAGRQRGASRAGIIGGLVLLAVAGFVIFQTLVSAQATCEVCMEHRGRSRCRAVSGVSAEEAKQAAVINACAYISGGVTDSMACQRSIPISEKCW